MDDPSEQGIGVCCHVGKKAVYNSIQGWSCVETTQCGIELRYECKYDFDLNRTAWYSSVFNGNISDWCNTQVTNLYHDEALPDWYNGSTGCCLIPKYGQINYWVDVGNVKIWG